MSSVGNQNPWAPYDSYRDCSLGICSIYCPQFCYLIFPPPPPSDDDPSTPFSPLIIAIIGALASAFLLVSYYTIVTRYCKRRRNNDDHRNVETEENRDELSRDTWQVGPAGLDDVTIKSITVCRYRKGDGLIEGTECAVCLSEFQENECLRLLPKCSHAFHLPCIDMWLKSHSNCPLCRANVVVSANSTDVNVSSYEIRRPDDLVLVVDEYQERDFHEQIVHVINENDDDLCDRDGVEESRTSVSFSTFSPQRQLLVSDILRFEEIDEYMQVEIDQFWRGIGSSKGDSCVEESKSSGSCRGKDGRLLIRSPVAMKRSISTGRFMGKVNDKGKNSIMIPN